MFNKKDILLAFLVLVIVFEAGFVFVRSGLLERTLLILAKSPDLFFASIAAPVNSPFVYIFKIDGVLKEAGSMDKSTSPYWWVNSGGEMILSDGLGMTVQGELPSTDKWRLAYAVANPVDTDNGYHPQNIFRLVLRSKWENFTQEAYFKIIKDNFSDSPNRNASNGLLLFNRYLSGASLYYTGIRVDGYAVIKKKINGVYYTMDYKPLERIASPYNKDTNPDLLPKNIWIGLRSEVKTNTNGTVSIKLYMDKGKTGNWTLVAQATDNGRRYGGAVISQEGYAGIRTDFMDVQFDDYRIENISG